jgi:NADP-dependent 3-hydroxy acid dehydrogenase YdfG
MSHPQSEAVSVQGKRIVVTGGTKGIGRATARLLASRGARVLVFGRHQEELDDALAELSAVGEVHGLVADTSVHDDVLRVFLEADRALGGLDALVNNAAIAGGSILDEPYEHWRYALNVNVLGYLDCCREAIECFRPQGHGHIVAVGSLSADSREKGNDVYVATKGAIQAFCESLRKQVNALGIKVSLVEPGLVATPLLEMPEEEMRRKLEAMEMIPPEDIAEAVHYCLIQPPRADVIRLDLRPHRQDQI